MNMLSSLPRTLLAILALADLAVLAVSLPTSTNDPFRAVIVVHRTQQPEPPLCCLKPLPTIDPPEGPEDVLLSFEEWKSKQSRAASQSGPARSSTVETHGSDSPSKTNVQHADVPPTDAQSPPTDLSYPYRATDDGLPPHFRVPITDRFNYANMDCSARVHMSHKSAKSAWSILSSKKDRYMLSPCSADPQFVVVELCDDIRIDTVQLANFEFFSGVFMDFSVSVAKTYTGTDEGWTPAGTYRAKNVRGVQSFHPPTSLRDFYRYIRLDFHSHYGHEYYCPVSLLRVYGLTHLEEWKWDTWQAESRARLKDSATPRLMAAEHPLTSNAANPNSGPNRNTNVSNAQLGTTESRSSGISQLSSVEATSTPTRESPSSRGSQSTNVESRGRSFFHVDDKGTSISSSEDGEQQTLATPITGAHSVTEAISSLLSISSPASAVSQTLPTTEHPNLYSHNFETHAITVLSSQPSNLPIPPPTQHVPAHAQLAPQWTGESIYRTIMNRLTLLEANHTLYARYVEEQTARVREVLNKLNEEVGRLESVSRIQAQMYQRTVHEWERQRLRLELEHGELLSRVNYLSDEVVLEKRLGIAQLCLLLAVLVFIGLTRGAPPAHHPAQRVQRSMREWGVRNLSFGSSTDGWNLLRGRSRSPTEHRSTQAEKAPDNGPLFPGPLNSPGSKPELNASTLNHQHSPRVFKSSAAPTAALSSHAHKRVHTSSGAFRTPTKPRPLLLMDPNTLPRAEPLTRSHSSSASGFAYARSAKWWARTAHLHEINAPRERRGSGGVGHGVGGRRAGAHKDKERENDRDGSLGDVFSASASASSPCHINKVMAKNRSQHIDALSRQFVSPFGEVARPLEESTDGDAWVDTDVDVDDNDASGTSESAVVLHSAERDVFGSEQP